MAHPLHSFWLKMNRAQSHARTLDAEIDAWLHQHPYGLFGEYDPGPPEMYHYRVRFFRDIPDEWGLLLGDFAHNARSALDHLAEALVVTGGGPSGRRSTQFPICVSPFDWPGQVYRLDGASPRHIGIIQAMQPYNRLDWQGWSTMRAAIEDPLAVLNRMSNVDKHRVLNATPATMSSISWEVEPIRDIGWHNPSRIDIPEGTLIDGDVLLSIQVRASGPNPELNLKREERIEVRVQHTIVLDEQTGAYTVWDVPLRDSTEAIIDQLEHIFEVFVDEFR